MMSPQCLADRRVVPGNQFNWQKPITPPLAATRLQPPSEVGLKDGKGVGLEWTNEMELDGRRVGLENFRETD